MSWGPDATARDNTKSALLSFLHLNLQKKDFERAKTMVDKLDYEAYSLGYDWAVVEIEAGDDL